MKKLTTTLALVLTAGLLSACTASAGEEGTLKLVASSTPHAEILAWIDEQHDDIDLDVNIVTGGPEANAAVDNGSVHANFFQHQPYLDDWASQTGKDSLTSVAAVHIEPIALYSTQHALIDDLPDGATIALPRSGSNFARGLVILADQGLITFHDDVDLAAVSQITIDSIDSNPKNLELTPVEDELAARTLDDPSIDAAVINSNFALEAGYDPIDDALLTESPNDNPYANILVTTSDQTDDPRITALAEALTSVETADWIRERFDSAVIPVRS